MNTSSPQLSRSVVVSHHNPQAITEYTGLNSDVIMLLEKNKPEQTETAPAEPAKVEAAAAAPVTEPEPPKKKESVVKSVRMSVADFVRNNLEE